MNEFSPNQMPSSEKKEEISIPTLHVINKGEIFEHGDNQYSPQSSGEIEKITVKTLGGIRTRYYFMQPVSKYTYIFRLAGQGREYNLSFKTDEYEYAKTNIAQEDIDAIFKTMNELLESCYQDSKEQMEIVHVNPADAVYTVGEIEGCMNEISNAYPEYTRERLMKEYKSFKVFDLYVTLFEKYYKDQHLNARSQAKARSRMFKALSKKFFAKWEVVDAPYGGADFDLKRNI
jgi:hypothetical protein